MRLCGSYLSARLTSRPRACHFHNHPQAEAVDDVKEHKVVARSNLVESDTDVEARFVNDWLDCELKKVKPDLYPRNNSVKAVIFRMSTTSLGAQSDMITLRLERSGGLCTGGCAQGAVHSGLCTGGCAQRAVHRGLCTRGCAQEAVHLSLIHI